MNAKQTVMNAIKSIKEIPDEHIEEFLAKSQLKTVNKGNCFIRAGEIPNKFAFVISGLFRYYYLDEKENELTKGFLPESSFITSYSALIQNRESYFTIEALEDSVILVIYYDEWKKLLENNIHWNKLLICLLEKAFCIKEAREREFLLFDAEERYRSFLNTFPGLENRIKQHFIASYLRITPVTLSRIRKKMGLLS